MNAGTLLEKEIAVYGAGGFGREIACLIQKINATVEDSVCIKKWKFVGFFDDEKVQGAHNEYGKFLGGIDVLNAFPRELALVIAIANPATLRTLSQKIFNPKISFPNLFAPDVILFDEHALQIGRGNIIGWGSRISCNVKIGDFNIAVGDLTLGHDACIGSHNVFFPEARISGGCVVGDGNFFGMRSAVLQYVKIGDETRIGAGSIVMTKTKNGALYTGIPARRTEF